MSASRVEDIVTQKVSTMDIVGINDVQSLIDERIAGGGAELVTYLKKTEAANTYSQFNP